MMRISKEDEGIKGRHGYQWIIIRISKEDKGIKGRRGYQWMTSASMEGKGNN